MKRLIAAGSAALLAAALTPSASASAASNSAVTSIPVDPATQIEMHVTADCTGTRCVFNTTANLLTPDGPTLDSGAMVTGLEFATERPARILGKPAAAFFREATAELAATVRAADGSRLVRRDVAMVGDDLRSDIQAARRLGIRAVLVLTGKHGLADVDTAGAAGGRRPDAIAADLRAVVAALG